MDFEMRASVAQHHLRFFLSAVLTWRAGCGLDDRLLGGAAVSDHTASMGDIKADTAHVSCMLYIRVT